jgi:uncharacterized membrane protein YfcA
VESVAGIDDPAPTGINDAGYNSARKRKKKTKAKSWQRAFCFSSRAYAIAGGGGLITFPLLMLVVGPMTADATSAVAGFASYPTAVWRTRNLLTGVLGSGWLWLLVIPSFLGGLIGALLLSHTGNRNFIEFVPWLVLLATIIIALRPVLVRRREGGTLQPDLAQMLWPFAMAGIFVVALYGGYFGAGIGILISAL